MIQTLRFFTNFNNLQNFQKFQNTDESPYFYMNHDRTRDEMPTPAHSSKLTKHRGECVLLQDDCFQISTFACMKPWKLLDSEFLVNAPWLKVAKEKCKLPNGKVIDDFYTLWQPDWVLILSRTKEGKWVMTEQYRHGTGKIALEFPAGIIDKGETPEEAAIRELQEECGFILGEGRFPLGGGNDSAGSGHDNITYLGSFPVNPDRHRGKFHVVFIDGVERLGKTHFDETEDIETFLYTDEEFQAKIADGTFDHPLQIAGYFKWKLTQK